MTSPETAFRSLVAITFVAAVGATTSESQAIILYRSATRNTTAPTGSFANSGWQYEGKLKTGDGPGGIEYGYLGTPIAPNYFITAAHIGGTTDGAIHVGAQTYNIDFSFNNSTTPGYSTMPGTDLRIWKVQQAFASYAPLYKPADGPEAGKTMIVFGRGTQRGAPIYNEVVTDPDQPNGGATQPAQLKGWAWGDYDSVQSWGTNVVSRVVNGGTGSGNLLEYNFDRNGLSDEGGLSVGDSGGAVFIQGTGGVWKLAGINYGVETGYRLSAPVAGIDTAQFDGSLFDRGGLYENTGNGYAFNPDTLADQPASSYSTIISSNISWITSIIGNPSLASSSVPEPASAAMLGTLLTSALLRRCRRSRSTR